MGWHGFRRTGAAAMAAAGAHTRQLHHATNSEDPLTQQTKHFLSVHFFRCLKNFLVAMFAWPLA